MQAIRRASAAGVRADLESYSLPGLKAKLRQVPVATEHEVADIASRLNAGVSFLFPEGRGQSTFFKLFRLMDRCRVRYTACTACTACAATTRAWTSSRTLTLTPTPTPTLGA